MSSDYELYKNDVIEKLSTLINDSVQFSLEDAIENWAIFTKHPFFELPHKADKTKVFSYLEDDDPDYHNPCEIDLYDREYILTTRKELEFEGIGTDKFFVIAGINGADDMCFLSSDFTKGVAVEYHDHVFCSKNLNERLEVSSEDLSLIDFIRSLNPR